MSAERPGWDDYFAVITRAVARRGDCTRARVGAVIVKDRRIVSTGYNGAEPGGPSCLKHECPHSTTPESLKTINYVGCVALHAEQNAIAYANRFDTVGATLYCTHAPCDGCTKLIKAAGILRVIVVGEGE